uniref:Pentraxin (PTX) domain-containing protein n=1 Tax=Salmo trutta TaxID=8032 RepID=A0A674ASS0_SALTR
TPFSPQLLVVTVLSHHYNSHTDSREVLFSFLLESDTFHVNLYAKIQTPVSAMTVCLRFFSEVGRRQSIVSLGNSFTPGNILNWKALEYTTEGKVFKEKSDFDNVA